ncbi:MAG TPA: CapA family protein [Ignavibacteriaceae bacterium]|nr:CapA family protein [Ignavibacteriaceae bacterium]
MKNIIYIFIAALFSFNFICTTNKAESFVKADSTTIISINVVGDIMCHSPQYQYAQVNGDSFDFKPFFRKVEKYFLNDDLTLGNFETTTAGAKEEYSGYPFFNSPDDYITSLKEVGFDILTTSNNHSLDKGVKGLLRTIDIMNLNGIHYNGTFASQRDRDSIRLLNIKGINIAFLSYSYGTNGLPVPKEKPYVINLLDTTLIFNDIRRAKMIGADIVFVHYHWGKEYETTPNKFQQNLAQLTFNAGADIIVGGHPHVLQPMMYGNKPDGRKGFIMYSMGNFISNQRKDYKDISIILNLKLKKDFNTNITTIDSVGYIPTYVYKGFTEAGNQYIVVPLNEIHKEPYLKKMQEELDILRNKVNELVNFNK